MSSPGEGGRRRTGEALRWLLVPFVAAVCWYGGLILGLMAVGVVDSLCPERHLELVSEDSFVCTAPWYPATVDGVIVLFAGLVAAGVVLGTAAVAPRARWRVGLVAWALGAAWALWFATTADAWGPFLGAAAGGTGALAAARRWRRLQEEPEIGPHEREG